MREPSADVDVRELSTGDLVARLGEQVSVLVRDELALAKAELRDKGRAAGLGAAFGGVAGVLAWFAGTALMIAAIAAFSLVMPAWVAALVVAGILLVIAGICAVIGIGKVKRAVPPVPEQAIDSIGQDVAAVREGAHR